MKCPKCHADNPDTSRFCGNCATSLTHDDKPGVTVTRTIETTAGELGRGTNFAGRYEIIEELGTGGMGRVFRVYDTKIKEEVALKLLRPDIASERRTIERFSNEIKYARKIVHKNVCRMFDMGEDRGTHFITMEYVAGEDLKSFLRRAAPLNTGRAVSLGREIAEGLAEAHKTGLIHRDLKPGNIMIDKEGHARIMDFGIAKSLKGKAVTGEGALIGTPEYMSPEQVEGKEADRRVDIYALGVILFEMVTGQTPFEGDTPLAVAVKHKSEPPPAPRTVNPQVPQDLDKLILRCLEKDKARRYQTAEDLADDLAAVEEALPTTERTAAKRTSTKQKRTHSTNVTVDIKPRKIIIVAASVLVLTIGGVLLWRYVIQPPPPPSGRPSVAFLPFVNRSGDPALDVWSENFSEWLYDRLAQSRFIDVSPTNVVTSTLSHLNLLKAASYTREDLQNIGRLAHVKYLVSGSFTRAGETFLVRATVQEATSAKPAGTLEVRGEGQASLIKMADELAVKIKPSLEVTAIEAANDVDGDIERVYTPSPEAYNYYLQGRKWIYDSNGDEAIAALEKAIAIDPDFAMAYRSLAAVYVDWNPAKYRECIEKALEISGRTDRLTVQEKLLIQGQSQVLPHEDRKKALTELLRLYPEDRAGHITMGNLYAEEEGELGKAAECYEWLIGQHSRSIGPYSNLVSVCVAQGNYVKAHKVLDKALADFSGQPNVLSIIQAAIGYLFQNEGKYREALAQIDKAESLQPKYANSYTDDRVTIYLLSARLAEAEAEIRRHIEDKDLNNRPYGRIRLAQLHLIHGRLREAILELRRLMELESSAANPINPASDLMNLLSVYDALGDVNAAERALSEKWKPLRDSAVWGMGYKEPWESQAIYWRSVLLWRKGRSEEALKEADRLAALVEAGPNKLWMKYPLMLQGRLELERGNALKAIELLNQSKSLEFHYDWYGQNPPVRVPIMDLLALAYFRAGDMEKARQEYEEITNLGSPRLPYGDKYAKSFYHLGQVYERLGKTRKAKQNYTKFLELWKNADPGLPEVADAKKRLAGL